MVATNESVKYETYLKNLQEIFTDILSHNWIGFSQDRLSGIKVILLLESSWRVMHHIQSWALNRPLTTTCLTHIVSITCRRSLSYIVVAKLTMRGLLRVIRLERCMMVYGMCMFLLLLLMTLSRTDLFPWRASIRTHHHRTVTVAYFHFISFY